jgi:hypothetical protein
MDSMAGSDDDEGLSEYRRHLYDALHAASRDYDQAILTLAAGTLALSVTFLHEITPTPIPWTRLLILAAWGSLGGSLIAVVASLATSQWVLRRQIDAIDRRTQWTMASIDRALQVRRATAILNAVAGIGLIVGLVLLAGTPSRTSEEASMTDKTPPGPLERSIAPGPDATRGYIPPPEPFAKGYIPPPAPAEAIAVPPAPEPAAPPSAPTPAPAPAAPAEVGPAPAPAPAEQA